MSKLPGSDRLAASRSQNEITKALKETHDFQTQAAPQNRYDWVHPAINDSEIMPLGMPLSGGQSASGNALTGDKTNNTAALKSSGKAENAETGTQSDASHRNSQLRDSGGDKSNAPEPKAVGGSSFDDGSSGKGASQSGETSAPANKGGGSAQTPKSNESTNKSDGIQKPEEAAVAAKTNAPVEPASNTAPYDIEPGVASISENSDGGAVVARLTATDPDAGDTHTYEIEGGHSFFEIVGDQIRVKTGVTIDFESQPLHNLTITATDAGGLSIQQKISITVGDMNEAPTLSFLSGESLIEKALPENLAGGGIGQISANDADAGDSLTYTVADDRFEISGGEVKLKPGVSVNYEAEPSVSLMLTATDAAGLSASQTVSFAVSDVSEAPAAQALENQTVAVGQTFALNTAAAFSDVDASDQLTYSLQGPAWLSIDPATGAISGTPPATLQFTALQETSGGYAVPATGVLQIDTSVISSDAGYRNAVGYYVADENGSPIGGAVVETNAHQRGDHSALLDLADYPGAASIGFFLIPNGGANAPVSDGEPVTFTQIDGVWHAVADGQILGGTGAPAYFSDAALNPDRLDHLADNGTEGRQNWEDLFGGGDNSFDDANLETTVRLIQAVPDTTQATVTVIATDQGGLSAQSSFTLDINSLNVSLAEIEAGAFEWAENQAPLEIALTTGSIAENAAGVAVGSLSVVDLDSAEGHNVAVSDSRFEVVDGQLQLKAGATLDYEAESAINLTVTATDSDGLSTAREFHFAVSDVNETPTELKSTGNSIAENSAGGTVIATLQTLDPDGRDQHTYEVTGDYAQYLEISGDKLILKDGVDVNFEEQSAHTIAIQVTDSGGLTFATTIDVSIQDVNEAPTLTVVFGDSFIENDDAAPENQAGASIAQIFASDADAGDTLTYSVSDERFEIANGELKLKSSVSLDHEAEPSVNLTLTATDAGGLSSSQTVSFTVSDVNEPPTLIFQFGDSVTENSNAAPENQAGIGIAQVFTNDPDAGDAPGFTVSDNRFEVSGGELRLKDGVSLDYEEQTRVTLDVTAMDQGGLFTIQTVSFNVQDVNEAPSDLALNGAEVAENAAGAVIGQLSAADADAGDSLRYAVSDSRFEIAGGQLKLKNGETLDHEAEPSLNLTITATDAGGLSTQQTFEIAVSDVNEAPVNLDLSNTMLKENPGDNHRFGHFTATDPSGGEIKYDLIDENGNVIEITVDGRFWIDGDILTTRSEDFDFESEENQFDLAVRATGAEGSTEKTFSVQLTDENETPTALAIETQTATAGQKFGLNAAAAFNDVDAGDHLTYTLQGPEWLKIDPESGAISGEPPAQVTSVELISVNGGYSVPPSGIVQIDTSVISSDAGYKNTVGYYVADGQGNPLGGAIVETDAHQRGQHSALLNLSDYPGAASIGFFLVPDGGANAGVADGQSVTFSEVNGVWHVATDNGALKGEGAPAYFSDRALNPDGIDHLIDNATAGGQNWEDLFGGGDNSFRDANLDTTVRLIQAVPDAVQITLTVIATDQGGLSAQTTFELRVGTGTASLDQAQAHMAELQAHGLNIDGDEHGNTIDFASDYGDRINGFGGNDKIWGAGGDDTINGGNGNDELWGDSGADVIFGGAGNDVVSGGDGTDLAHLGDGDDIFDTTNGNADVGDGSDIVFGDGGNDRIWGGGSDDVLDGGSGNDMLAGESGDDTLIGGSGNDRLEGGSGADSLDGGHNNDVLLGGDHDDILIGETGNDDLNGEGGADNLFGGQGNDKLYGGAGDDALDGADGNDLLDGGAGDDVFFGGSGNDHFYGADGSDLFLFGGADGRDSVNGGAGGSWIDAIDLRGGDGQANPGAFGTDWTLKLTHGSILSQDEEGLTLSEDADGLITLDTGNQINFNDIERIEI
ncbi:MAG: cadherin domain-containing protein [Chitinophagales bacterium]|nr:cadherin domain-containing protein [Hyphomicrobiales bacterium]